MSRAGKAPIAIPGGVKAAIAGGVMTVEGPKGRLSLPIPAIVSVTIDAARQVISVAPAAGSEGNAKSARRTRAIWGTTQRLIANMIRGVSEEFVCRLQVVGVGYTARIQKQNLILRIGYANERTVPIPEGVTVDPPEVGNVTLPGFAQTPCTTLTIRSADKQRLGQFAASVRRLRKPEPYKGRGIKYIDEEVKHKAGKALAAGAK